MAWWSMRDCGLTHVGQSLKSCWVRTQVFDMIETQMVRHRISNALPMRILYRSIYVIIVAFVGM